MLANILQIVGVGAIVVGGFLVFPPLGWVLAGVGLILL